MTYSQKYTLVAFLEPVSVGTEFAMDSWPLHTTLADVFAIDHIDSDIDAKLEKEIAKHSVIKTVATDDAVLGTTAVILLENTTTLQSLHDSIIDTLESGGAEFNSPQFTHRGYLPHCTIQRDSRLHSGDAFEICEIALIDMFTNGNWQNRKVLNTFRLSTE